MPNKIKKNDQILNIILAGYVLTVGYLATAYHYVNSIINGRSYVIAFVPILSIIFAWILFSKNRLRILAILAILATLALLAINLINL